DGLNIEPLVATYKGGGSSSYNPLMLLKVLVYAYLSKNYASRKIARALREDVNYMWLSGMYRPDFRTINIFRSGRLKGVVDQVFGSMVEFCIANKYIKLENYFVDGTKMEANARKTSYVWSKNTERYKEATQKKIKELLEHIEEVNRQENAEYGESDLEELGNGSTITSEKLKEQIEKLNTIINPTKPNKQVLKELQTKQIPKLERYEEQERLLGGRKSYSKTDTDATFFRMKNDQLLPAYNVMIGTENQFIVNYSIHQKASEADQFIRHFTKLTRTTGLIPEDVIGDAAYGSEENYAFLEEHGVGNYLKYNTYHRENTKKHRDNCYHKDNFQYYEKTDTYRCPEGRDLIFDRTGEKITYNGYQQNIRIYECIDCCECPVASRCKKGIGNRTINVNPRLERYRAQARANLASDYGIALRKKRGVDVEPVFGDIKMNQEYKRFRLRGKEKVNVEFGLLSILTNVQNIVS
ncbi:MAG: IS1182 family transposase, partial [Bacteroidota bacterium]|nr:IS1182 family transposase [Bacteroidota bacterium]